MGFGIAFFSSKMGAKGVKIGFVDLYFSICMSQQKCHCAVLCYGLDAALYSGLQCTCNRELPNSKTTIRLSDMNNYQFILAKLALSLGKLKAN